MDDSLGHVFIHEFDDLCIVISLDMGITSATMHVTISEPNSVWDELVQIPMNNLHELDAQKTRDKSGMKDESATTTSFPGIK
jgi:hypothetical protein